MRPSLKTTPARLPALGVAVICATAALSVALAQEAPRPEPSTPPTAARQDQQQEQGGDAASADAAAPATRPWRLRAGDGASPDGPAARFRHNFASALATEAPSDEEWKNVETFMEEYSPNRLRALEENVSEQNPRYHSLRRFIYGQYKALNQLKEKGDQDLYDLRVETIQIEDEVWGLMRKLRETPDSERQIVRQQLREKVAQMILLGDKERQVRIARLEKALAAEKEKLAADSHSFEQRLEERLRNLYRPSGYRRPAADSPTDAPASPNR